MHSAYEFPEKDAFRALEVTEPEFDILAEPAYESLYVDFSAVRTQRYKQRMKMLPALADPHQGRQSCHPQQSLRRCRSHHPGVAFPIAAAGVQWRATRAETQPPAEPIF